MRITYLMKVCSVCYNSFARESTDADTIIASNLVWCYVLINTISIIIVITIVNIVV